MARAAIARTKRKQGQRGEPSARPKSRRLLRLAASGEANVRIVARPQ
jgi:hypothetical protein